MNILCKLGLHRWKEAWRLVPNPAGFDASRSSSWKIAGHKCRRCGVRK